MRQRLIDRVGPDPVLQSWGYADAVLRGIYPQAKNPQTPFYRRGRLWVPLECAIAILAGSDGHVQTIGTGASSAIDTTGATLLVAAIGGLASIVALTDSKSNTWTPLTAKQGGAGGELKLYYVANPTVGSSHTFTNASNGFAAMDVQAFSGVVTTSPLDQESGAVAAATQAGSITPGGSDYLFVAASGGGVDSFSAIDSSFTCTDHADFVGGVNYSCMIAYLVNAGSSAAKNPTWTLSGGGSGNACVMATFKPAAGGGTSILPILMSQFRRRKMN